ncbi:bifunctional transcriptional activator/DNA repair enzyme AdaA [Paenibacillus sp. WLX2291]|uniref:bifunctional transcriptional activator/DNA repair enzyme AdaA n=1 Tax=Paenibacillus sp. WLX2291 TaxID=3296934 RepID=UPI0039841D80
MNVILSETTDASPVLTDVYWQAIVQNDQQYDGTFFYSVKTTKIFCRPSCKSRIPNRHNVRLFSTVQQAMQAGFQACKRCCPDQLYSPQEQWVEEIVQLIHQYYWDDLKLEELSRLASGSPFHLQRSFRIVKGYTPTQYIQTVRIREAEKLLLTTTQSISQIGIQVGLDNPSYFATLFKQKTGFTPTAYRQQHLAPVQNEAAR